MKVGEREIIRSANMPIPAFRVKMEYSGLQTTSWVTDTGEIVREESPLGFITVRETSERARALAVPGEIRQDLLKAAAVVPNMSPRVPPISDPRDVRRLRLRIEGADLTSADLIGVGQRVVGDVVEIVDAQTLVAGATDPDIAKYLEPEALIESDDPDIRAAAIDAVRGIGGARARAEALTRYVNSTVQKKPTVTASAREVLLTRIGTATSTRAVRGHARSLASRRLPSDGVRSRRFLLPCWPEVYS